MQVIVTNTCLQNGGDAAIFFANLEILKQAFPKSRLVAVEDIAPGTVQDVYSDLPTVDYSFPSRAAWGKSKLINKILSILRRTAHKAIINNDPLFKFYVKLFKGTRGRADVRNDLTVSMGGTYLIERYEFIGKLLNLAIAQSVGEKTVLMTQSLGPFTSARNQRAITKVLGATDLILLRDELSRRHLQEIGFDHSNMHVLADSVFVLAELDEWARRDHTAPARDVLISVRDCSLFQDDAGGEERYRTAVAELTAHLVQTHGCTVTFRSTCQGIPGYHFDDSAVADDIRARLASDTAQHVQVDRTFRAPDAFQQDTKTFGLMISTRLHGAIQALNAGTPVIPIAYEFKIEEVWAGFGLEDNILKLAPQDPASWISIVDAYFADPTGYAQKLEAGVTAARTSAAKAITLLQQTLVGPHGAR